MIKLLVIADDFTGGLDTGVQFAGHGIRTRVVTDPDAEFTSAADGAEVLVVVAETRHISAESAYDMVYRVAKKGADLGIQHIYKKTDSALRGNIGAELSAVMNACKQSWMPFMPSMPGIGRKTIKGIHYIDGVPVAESVFGKDPFEPVRESDVCKLVSLQTTVQVQSISADEIKNGMTGLVVVNAETENDLRNAGSRLAEIGGLRIMAGCAGFAAVLPEVLGLTIEAVPTLPKLDDGLFVLCGSVNPITLRQLNWAEQNGFSRLHIAPEQKLEEGYFDTEAGTTALANWQNAELMNKWMILDANDQETDNHETAALAEKLGLTTEDVRARISGALGRILPEMLSISETRTLLITGGDTLLQCMNRMRVNQMEPLLEMFPGVVLSQFVAEGQPRYVITKSGGFGKESLLTDLMHVIENQNH